MPGADHASPAGPSRSRGDGADVETSQNRRPSRSAPVSGARPPAPPCHVTRSPTLLL